MSPLTVQPDGVDDAGVRRCLEALERYAGWLGHDTRSTRLRASVQGLALAVNEGGDVFGGLRDFRSSVDGLSPGGVTPLLRPRPSVDLVRDD